MEERFTDTLQPHKLFKLGPCFSEHCLEVSNQASAQWVHPQFRAFVFLIIVPEHHVSETEVSFYPVPKHRRSWHCQLVFFLEKIAFRNENTVLYASHLYCELSVIKPHTIFNGSCMKQMNMHIYFHRDRLTQRKDLSKPLQPLIIVPCK